MDNGILVATQAQRVLQRRLEIAANNLANANTAGFKSDFVLTREHEADPASARDRPRDVRFVRDVGAARDLTQGGIAKTGAPFDVAIEGGGFFTVQGPGGPLYTRDGAFRLNAENQLVTRDGMPVLDAGGAPIVIEGAADQPPIIDAEGAIMVGDVVVANLAVVDFNQPRALNKVGDNLFEAAGQPPAAFTGRVVGGALESSNVRPVIELTQVLEISRAYESAARIVRQGDDLRQRTIERLGRS